MLWQGSAFSPEEKAADHLSKSQKTIIDDDYKKKKNHR